MMQIRDMFAIAKFLADTCDIRALFTTEWAKLNGANAVSFVVVKHVLENFDNF